MSVSGLRVLRGPDWRGGDTDGGEGHVGTVIELLGNHTVRVLWDMGQESTCSAGHDGKRELIVFDTAQIGVRHPGSRCSGCGESAIYGILWRCRDCPGCDLCSLCYSEDKHVLGHPFLRVDTAGTPGHLVLRRKTSVKNRSLGLFPGSKVTRGKDGGQGSEGEVKGYENASPDSCRNMLKVEWPSGDVNSYRAGYHGNVDVTCVEEEVGPYYYRDHLPVLDSDQIAKLTAALAGGSQSRHTGHAADQAMSSVDSAYDPSPPASPPHSELMTSGNVSTTNTSVIAETGGAVMSVKAETSTNENGGREVITSADGEALTPGVRVAVRFGLEKLLLMQRECGADTEDLERILGKTGHVNGEPVTDKGGVVVKFQTDEVSVNPKALVKVHDFQKGDRVRLRKDRDELKALNCRGGWKDQMEQAAGKVGEVVHADTDGDLKVSFGSQHFVFAPACCTPVPGDTPVDSLQVTNDEKIIGGAAKTHCNDGGDESSLFQTLRSAVMKERTTSLLSSLSSDPADLFIAAQRGDHHTVRQICMANRSLLEHEIQRVTPLILACGHGHREVARVLLECGADVNHCLSSYRAPTYIATQSKDEELVLMLLEHGADPFHLDGKRHTLVHKAAWNDMPRVIRILVDRGVDANAQDDYGDTALHVGIMDHNHRAVEGLMAIPGIDLSLRNRSGFPPLHHAVMKGNARALELMVEKDKSEIHTVANGVTPLRLAVNNDQDECVRVLILMGGCDVNRPFANSSSLPLLLACVRAVYRAAEALLELGADVNAQDLGGQTALHNTISGRRIEDRHVENNESTMAEVHEAKLGAIQMGPQSEQEKQVRVALACLLVSNGAYVDVEDFGGRDPLSHGDPDVIEGVKSFMTKNPELVRHKSERESSKTGAASSKTAGASSITGCSHMDIGQRFNQLSMSTKREPFMSASSSIDPGNTGDQLSISTVRKEIKSVFSTADPGKGEDRISTSTKRDSIMFDQGKSGVKLKEALKGVGLPCGMCGAPKADVTLLPCQHKCVCSTCSVKVTECLLCEEVVQDKIVTGADGQSVHPNDCKQM